MFNIKTGLFRLPRLSFSSVHTLGSGTGGSRHHLAIDCLDLGNSLHDDGCVNLLVGLSLITASVAGVTNQKDGLELGELSELGNLIPGLDLVVANEEGVEFGEGRKTF